MTPDAERASNEDHERAAIAAQGASGTWDWDVVADRLRVDEHFAHLYGFDPFVAREGLATKLFFSRIHEADRARIKIAVAGMLAGAEIFSKEFRVHRADGAVRWVHGRGQSHFDSEERPVRFTGLLVDVTERRWAEERLRIAQTAGGVGTFEHRDGFATVSVSAEFCRVLGLHPTDVLPVTTVNGTVSSSEHPLIPEGDAAHLVGAAEFRIRRSNDGQVRWIARRGEIVHEDEGSGYRFLGVIYDVTASKVAELNLRELNETLESRVEEAVRERLHIEEALRQSQKMEAVGQLTGGIAHDFNNLLTIILGNIETVGRRLGPSVDPRIRRSLEHASKGAERAAALTQRLLAFSRRQPLDPKPTDVERILAGMTDLITRAIGETIAVHVRTEEDLSKIEVDQNQFENAILNLAVNARDAMSDGGSLSIEARNHDVGDEIVIEVTDTGCGMLPETIAKVFDPFFTTKEVGKGTGLGLSMVHGFVSQSHGRIEIESEIGSGTSIRLFFPVFVGEVEIIQLIQMKDVEQGQKNETVLVVEDDEDVRVYTVSLLRELGYRVIEAQDGEGALRLIERKDLSIDLLLTDVVMPTMSGRELAEKARAERVELPVLFTSGYPREQITKDGRIEPGIDLLPKPFSYSGMAEKVRTMLDRKRRISL
jgi:PAS domain S-box-containing protein